MKERREYSRIGLNIDTIVFLENGDEINCIISDISETGICIKLEGNEKTLPIKEGDILSFQTVDTFILYDKEVIKYINGDFKILRIQNINGVMFLGCIFTYIPQRLLDYIRDRKVALYIQSGFML